LHSEFYVVRGDCVAEKYIDCNEACVPRYFFFLGGTSTIELDALGTEFPSLEVEG